MLTQPFVVTRDLVRCQTHVLCRNRDIALFVFLRGKWTGDEEMVGEYCIWRSYNSICTRWLEIYYCATLSKGSEITLTSSLKVEKTFIIILARCVISNGPNQLIDSTLRVVRSVSHNSSWRMFSGLFPHPESRERCIYHFKKSNRHKHKT